MSKLGALLLIILSVVSYAQINVHGLVMTDDSVLVSGVRVVLGGKFDDVTTNGEFNIQVPTALRSGYTVIVEIEDDKWEISSPFSKRLNLPNEQTQTAQSQTIVVLPKGAFKLGTEAQIKAFVAQLQEERDRAILDGQNTVNIPRDKEGFTNYLRRQAQEYAKENGLNEMAFLNDINIWSNSLSSTVSCDDKALKAFARGDFETQDSIQTQCYEQTKSRLLAISDIQDSLYVYGYENVKERSDNNYFQHNYQKSINVVSQFIQDFKDDARIPDTLICNAYGIRANKQVLFAGLVSRESVSELLYSALDDIDFVLGCYSSDESRLYADTYFLRGLIYMELFFREQDNRRHFLDSTVTSYSRALERFKVLSLYSDVGSCYNDLGTLYSRSISTGRLKDKYLQDAMRLAKNQYEWSYYFYAKVRDYKHMANSDNNLGALYNESSNCSGLDSAYLYFDEALSLYLEWMINSKNANLSMDAGYYRVLHNRGVWLSKVFEKGCQLPPKMSQMMILEGLEEVYKYKSKVRDEQGLERLDVLTSRLRNYYSDE